MFDVHHRRSFVTLGLDLLISSRKNRSTGSIPLVNSDNVLRYMSANSLRLGQNYSEISQKVAVLELPVASNVHVTYEEEFP